MIKTVADFLEEFKSKGLFMISENEDIDHPGLIGNMYEGLTQAIINKAVFQNLNLKIVSGKITNVKGQMTRQIDCMVVEGEGRRMPFSNDWIFNYNQVVAVIEVKKNLFTSDLASSYENLKTVLDVSREPEQNGEEYMIRALRDAWRGLLQTELPLRSEVGFLSEEKQAIYHTLLMEAYFPIRIVIGYYGYKSEKSLREGFASLLEENIKKGNIKGFGIGSFPSLIICGNNSILKNNGMPYYVPFNNESPFYWHIAASSSKTPIIHLLEVIWTRLSYKYKLSSSIFGDDFEFVQVHPFLDCRVARLSNGLLGWEYKYQVLEDEVLNTPQIDLAWKPVIISQLQAQVLLHLNKNGHLNFMTDTDFINLIQQSKLSVDNFISTLVSTGLVYKKENEILFLTDRCEIVFLPNGDIVAGENKSGELSNWLNKYMAEKEKK